MNNGRITLKDLSAALKRNGATLELQLCSGGHACKAKIEWAARPAHMGASIEKRPDTPRDRMLKLDGSLEDVIETIAAWAQEELPVTYYSATNGRTLNNDGDKKNGE